MTFFAFACNKREQDNPTPEPPTEEHVHAYETVVVDPTCTAGGYTDHICACGNSYRDSETGALGHDYKTTLPVNDESHKSECFRCHIAQENGIGEHNFTPDGTGVKCSDCGFTVHSSQGLFFTLNSAGDGYNVSDGDFGSAVLVIPDEYNGKPVTGIEEGAFSNTLSWIRNIVLPKNLKSIESGAWSNFRANRVFFRGTLEDWCAVEFEDEKANPVYHSLSGELWIDGENVKKLDVPSGVTEIGNYAFAGCEGLEELILPETLVTVGERAFDGCVNLNKLSIPSSINSIEAAAFNGCPLENVTSNSNKFAVENNCFINKTEKTLLRGNSSGIIPSDGSITKIGDGAFENTSVRSVRIPDAVTEIGVNAFRNCDLLESVTFGNKIADIPNYAFDGCASLKKVVLPDSVKTVGNCAFQNCYALTSVTLGRGLTSIASASSSFFDFVSAFSGCDRLFEVYNLSSLTVTAGANTNGKVAKAAKDVYTSASDVSKITSTSDGLTFYGGSEPVLIGYEGLAETVVLPEKYEGKNYSVAAYAFYKNGTLKNVTVPKGVTKIGPAAFESCTVLEQVKIDAEITELSNKTFYGCENLTVVNLADGLKTVGVSAFEECSRLTSVGLPEGLTEIRERAFYGCKSLENIELPESLTLLGSTTASTSGFVFADCIALKSVTIPQGVTAVCRSTFSGCRSLSSVTMRGVVTVKGYAFRGCTALREVNMPSVTSVLSNAFIDCISLTKVTIPENAESIGNYAFYGCSALSSIELGDGLKSIGAAAFYGHKASSVYIPASVTTVGGQAFACGNSLETSPLTDIYCGASEKPDGYAEWWDYNGSGASPANVHWGAARP